MRRVIALLALLGMWAATPATAQDRAVVEASAPEALAVTVYRDPNRYEGEVMNTDWPQGFAMISETRSVTLPPGRSTIRFDGVAEGMVAVSAIVSGLPGGTIEKNRNAELLSPAALVNGMLGNRITVTRTNPATGVAISEDGIVRTRADGGLVLQTPEGYEAVRCSGLPERLTFDDLPIGLSANPVFTIDTADETGGTYSVTLSYLSWGFDWEANYVATVHEGRDADDVRFDLTSWLTILNDNGQSFENAELMAVAGTLNVVSDFETLAEPPRAQPLRLSCWPSGSTAAGSPLSRDQVIMVTARRQEMLSTPMAMMSEMAEDSAVIVVTGAMAREENLGDLKLYRIPMPVDVNAQGLKQVAFLREESVEGELMYQVACGPNNEDDAIPATMLLETVNDEDSGLGMALPSGSVAVFERSTLGELLVAEEQLRDYASGQDVELSLGSSAQVFLDCEAYSDGNDYYTVEAELSNANPEPVTVRIELGESSAWRIRGVRSRLRNGQRIAEVRVPGNGTRSLDWTAESTDQ